MIPGPRAETIRPRRKITARSYSFIILIPLMSRIPRMTTKVTGDAKSNIACSSLEKLECLTDARDAFTVYRPYDGPNWSERRHSNRFEVTETTASRHSRVCQIPSQAKAN